MPRLSRVVFAGVPHHITQRGNRRDDVFYSDEDREVYLAWLKDYAQTYDVDVLAYCLMTNHIHLVAVPGSDDALEKSLRPLHMRYAQRINRRNGWKGHLWQGRFFSSPLDDTYLWAAIRYVERNPVRTGLVHSAESYRWSSAAGHCGLTCDALLSQKPEWDRIHSVVEDWSAWLSVENESSQLERLRLHVEKGLPCGSDEFVQSLSRIKGRDLDVHPQGRPRLRDKKEP